MNFELGIALPLDRRILGETKQSRHPEHVLFAAAATELSTEIDVLEVVPEVCRVAFNLSQSAHLAGSDDLILIE